jgi:DNA topoisomerase IA
MRTDSTNLSKVAQSSILSLVEKKYGKEYAEAHIYKAKSKNAQEAHEAIRPTHIENISAHLVYMASSVKIGREVMLRSLVATKTTISKRELIISGINFLRIFML